VDSAFSKALMDSFVPECRGLDGWYEIAISMPGDKMKIMR